MNAAIVIALAAAALSCYFSACHIALKTFSRTRLSDILEQRGRANRLESIVARLPSTMIVAGLMRTMLNLVVLLAVFYEVESSRTWGEPLLKYLFSFLIAGAIVIVSSVAVPASWARYHREELLAWSLPILDVLRALLFPILGALRWIDPVVRRLTGADLITDNGDDLSDQIMTVVEDHDTAEMIDDAQKEMLEAVFELPSTDVGEIMTPRTDVEGIEVNSTLAEVKKAVIRYGHSRIPVYEEDLDHIVGILYAKDLIGFLGDGGDFNLREVLREPFLVPESKSIREMLAEFKARKVHMAIVLDEYGGTAGLVTIEDILEEIVGEIQDEYEQQEESPPLTRIDERTYDADARINIDDFNDELDVELPEDGDYDTLGGFIFATLGHIPEAGEMFEFQDLRFTITDAERTKVNRVRIERISAEAVADGGNGAMGK